MTRVHIGTSGWSYKGWHNTFYPSGLRPSDHYRHYASQFGTVEINLTFYRLPSPQLVLGWLTKAPEHFVYAVKGSRFITHLKKIANLDDALTRFFERMAPLKPRMGPVLWQLPPNLTLDLPRLDAFLEQLPKDYLAAVEFRHPSWLVPDTYELLRSRGVAFVSVSSLLMPIDFSITAGFAYIRFHGLQHGAAHDYSLAELQPWADHILRLAHQDITVYAYFNNDWNVRAPANARTLMEMTGLPLPANPVKRPPSSHTPNSPSHHGR